MMSATVVSAGAASSGYYKTEGYYAAGSAEGDAAVSWFGKGAEALGLEGRVNDEIFTQMLDGQTFVASEDGPIKDRLMGKHVGGERQHRPGMDLTFSAPKSVSIAALVYGDDRLVEAHDQAVHTAMAYVEQNLVQTRLFKNGALEVETGGKIIAGLFRHDTSRALDPQLHTHAVIANMVENSEGRLTALHNDQIFQMVKLGSEIYRTELAKSARELGYTVDRVGKDRLIELREIPRDLVALYSKRRAEIEAAIESRGLEDSAKTAELAALATRAAKHGNLDRDELHAAWVQQAEQTGMDRSRMDGIIQDVKRAAAMRLPGVTRECIAPAPHAADARDSLNKAIAHISERSSVYAEADLLTTAMGFAGNAGLSAMEHEVALAKKDGRLLPARDQSGKTDLLTDEQSLAVERDISRLYRMGSRQKGVSLRAYGTGSRVVNIRPEIALKQRLDRTTLSDGQRDSIVNALTGKGQVVGVQGYAGTGKTFMLAKLAGEAERAGYKIEGLAPSAQATQQLKDALPASETLQARLLRQRSPDKGADPRKTILVVDESSMVSNAQMKALLDQARDQKIARVVLVGDVQQLDAVAAGTPFALMQKLGMRTAVMDDIQRQRNDDTLAVINHAIAGEVRQAFEKIGENIQTSRDIAQSAADAYLNLRRRERSGIGLVTPSNKSRVAINEAVRDGLRTEGTIHGKEHLVLTLSPQRLSRVEAADPSSYKLGDVVIPHQSVASAGLTKGRQYDVIEVNPREGRVTLLDRETGTTLPFAPQQNSKAAAVVDAYEKTSKGFALGDAVKFRITDKDSGILNGESGKIRAISDDTITVKTASGEIKTLDRSTLAAAGMDHAYALTVHDFQGATVDRIIVAMSANERLADQKNFYVSVSRARDQVTLITDRPDDLARRLEEQSGEKITALEAWLEAERDKAREQHQSQSDARETRERDEIRDQELSKKEPEKAPDSLTTEMERTTRDLEKLIQKQLGDFER